MSLNENDSFTNNWSVTITDWLYNYYLLLTFTNDTSPISSQTAKLMRGTICFGTAVCYGNYCTLHSESQELKAGEKTLLTAEDTATLAGVLVYACGY